MHIVQTLLKNCSFGRCGHSQTKPATTMWNIWGYEFTLYTQTFSQTHGLCWFSSVLWGVFINWRLWRNKGISCVKTGQVFFFIFFISQCICASANSQFLFFQISIYLYIWILIMCVCAHLSVHVKFLIPACFWLKAHFKNKSKI